MGLLDIFKGWNKATETTTAGIIEEPVIDPSLFMDTEEPGGQVSTDRGEEGGRIEKFLRVDYEWYGYSEGYATPSAEYLEMKLRTIRNRFRTEVDRCLDERRTDIAKLKLHQIKMKGLSEIIQKEIQEKLGQLESEAAELERQKGLSVDDEGLVAGPVNLYRLGFMRGVEKYNMEKLVASSTGLFKSNSGK
jgi:hypothetical protein